MAKVVIVGAGGVGRVVAHTCARYPKVFETLLLASRSEHKCKAIAKDVLQKHNYTIQTAALDADDKAQSIALLRSFKADLLIHVALPYQDLTLMEACLETKTHYLDTANYEPREEARFSYDWQWAYHAAFQKKGLTAILGCGFDPGVTNIFTAYAVKHHFDELLQLDIVDCNAGEHDRPFATNFNAEINIREVTQEGKYYEKGQWRTTPPQAMHRLINYPKIGSRKSYLLYHEELESLVKHFPTLQRARFWMTFSESYLNYLRMIMDIGMGSIRPIHFEGKEVVPLQFLQAVLPKSEDLAPNYSGETSIGCHLRGIKDGRARSCYLYNNCAHADAYKATGTQAVAFTTGVPATIGALMLLTRKWKPGTGVFNVEQCDPDPFLDALSEAGLPWEEQFDITLDI